MIPEPIQQFIHRQAERSPQEYGDLRAVFLNGTLKRSPEVSHTDGLMAISIDLMRALGVRVDVVRTVDHVIPPGVQPDMRKHGWERDDFPDIYGELIAPADIIVLATPIWLGDQSSPTRLAIERLYGWSGELNEAGQWSYYGKVGGVIVTGNEDGGKHCAAQMLYALQHIGLAIPPQSDAYWDGEAGPGPSYLDEPGGGQQNAWTTRNTVFMTWNILHLARMLKDAGGVPTYGNIASDWDLSQPGHPNPEYR
ncbi:MAG: flavodoxin family protein [Actinomycetota bacterium]